MTTKLSCRQLAARVGPAFAHMGATGVTAPPSGRTGTRPPRQRACWLRGRQLGAQDKRLGGGTPVAINRAGRRVNR
jgi:hypothetical protein